MNLGYTLLLWGCVALTSGCYRGRDQLPDPLSSRADNDGCYHVYPGEDIQQALEAAARDPQHKTVIVHEGVYRPAQPGQALIFFNSRHDGISLIADGDVTLTAANPAVADPAEESYPAVVNHIVYFGHGVSEKTVMRGFKLTGANGFVSRPPAPEAIEPATTLPQLAPALFFYMDGGAIKVFARSRPQLLDLEIVNNATRLCGGGISIEQRGYQEDAVLIKDCVFRNNRCPATGSAVDVLSGSSAVIVNCLFVGNISNTGMDEVAREWGLRYHPEHGSGALTVFPGSRVEVRRCTFTGNWNGADDAGESSVYADCIFWKNTAGDGSRPGRPYELDILDASNVENCWLNGEIEDLRSVIDPAKNTLQAPNPHFDKFYQPRAEEYEGIGYRRSGQPRESAGTGW
ncbi:MAG: right-handed parallel beta-helix repeat-containing protein [Planctomycetes bacterium]|nr:right-handed parallel beta-helix repeat-containing protein [Planctomycetota bacterium]